MARVDTSAGGHEFDEESKGSDLHHPSHEFLAPSSTLQLPTFPYPSPCQAKRDLGSGLRVPRCGQSKVCQRSNTSEINMTQPVTDMSTPTTDSLSTQTAITARKASMRTCISSGTVSCKSSPPPSLKQPLARSVLGILSRLGWQSVDTYSVFIASFGICTPPTTHR